MPRFTLSEAEGIADQARAIFERRGDPIDPLWLFLRKLADHAGWGYFIRRALTIALQAGLIHQIDKMRQAYGPALELLLAE